MTNYEVMFILDSALEEDAKNAAVEMVKNIHHCGRRRSNERRYLGNKEARVSDPEEE